MALNPVRAGLVELATDWPWSSVHAQLGDRSDEVTATAPVRSRCPDFAALLASGEDEEALKRLRMAETIGRPIGDLTFIETLEGQSRRVLQAS